MGAIVVGAGSSANEMMPRHMTLNTDVPAEGCAREKGTSVPWCVQIDSGSLSKSGSGESACMFASLGSTMRQNYPFLPYINGATAAAGKSVGGAVDGLDKVDSGKEHSFLVSLLRCGVECVPVLFSQRPSES